MLALWILVMPSQCRASGIIAWKRVSVMPATFSVQLKYSEAWSPPCVIIIIFITSSFSYSRSGQGTCLGSLAHVVDEVLGDLTEGAALLPEIDHYSTAPWPWTWRDGGCIDDEEEEEWWTVAPCCAVRMHSSMAWARYGRQVQMSEPNTSEPLHSSCTRTVRGIDSSGMVFGSPHI